MRDDLVRITRRVEFDAGHRIPSHQGKCKHLHGHRYALEVTVSGPVTYKPDSTDHGMVVDFGDLKTLLTQFIVEPWDHKFLVWAEDMPVREALERIGSAYVILQSVPTAENLACYCFDRLNSVLRGGYLLEHVRLYETPNAWADIYRQQG